MDKAEDIRLWEMLARWEERYRQGQDTPADELCRECPELLGELQDRIRALKGMDWLLNPMDEKSKAVSSDEPDLPFDFGEHTVLDGPGRVFDRPVPGEDTPTHIGRYRIENLLGQGGFGLVYLAHDDQLQRPVAIKVPHPQLVARPDAADAYLAEARTVANLDHPHIVPVYDVGSTPDYPCYIVAKYIDGTDLASRLKQSRLALHEAAELVATVAEALHHAHKQGLVHRDIKPGNILLDRSGKPFVADFGLALREQDIGKVPGYAGTPAYMSPEQVRGEGHRVDGRSDIFSLGVVFYEILAGRRPFKGDSLGELLEQIAMFEPRPPRQIDDRIPKELDRISLKALSKRASERYSVAGDMGEDLRHFLAVASAPKPAPGSVPMPSDSQPLKIVPKGLRSFDAEDAEFFLELLPGPRDREGLPDSIRFWKTRIERTDADNTFSVGLIYGPSGSGKSSLIKAGLLPRLAGDVIAIYVEATAEETEARLLKGLRQHLPDLPSNLGLIEALAALRRGHHLEADKRMLLVLDQFEQWLHASRIDENTKLVQALRQCDGERVQCIVMVRDDFWMAATRFMAKLEINLVQGQNCTAVDLFDTLHARKVLAAFGRAYGRLPDNLGQCSKEQNQFLDQAVAGLAQDGKVISVRLALFADMVKGKWWTPATLKEVGGTEGVGVTFLEETFTASTAPPQHRLHQKAAQAVLKALLPESGTNIKGHVRSQQGLLEASGYVERPKEFADLQRILDGELRLITPTDPEGEGDAENFTLQAGTKYYQLTHDYLIHSLRDWLTRKQKETRRGRAELLLADRAAVWNARQENRQLPSLWQWCSIRWLTQRKNWTPPQRKMMRKASLVHFLRVIGIGISVVVCALGGLYWYKQRTVLITGQVDHLVVAEIQEVPKLILEMESYRSEVNTRLAEIRYSPSSSTGARLRTSLALLPADATQVEYLYGRLLDAEPPEVPVIRDALASRKSELVNRLWGVVEKPEKGKEQQRLRAACALASYDVPDNAPGTERWQRASTILVDELLAAVQKNPSHYATLLEQLRPVRASLLLSLTEVYRSKEKPETERSFATNILADYAADKPDDLAKMLMDADEKQFGVVFPKLMAHGEKTLALLTGEIDKKLPADLPLSDMKRETLAKRQVNAAVALLKMNQPEKVWPLLKHSPDPRVRSYLIHRFGPLGVDAGALLNRLDEEADITIRRALILSLGEFGEKELPPEARMSLLAKLQAIYRTDADPGLHSSVEWLLRHWKQEAWLKQVNENWANDKGQRDRRIKGIHELLHKDREKTPPQWYVNSQCQTMVVIPGPVEFLMGSPETEEGRGPEELQHKRRIGRTFALAAAPVKVGEFRRFLKDSKLEAWFSDGGRAAPFMKKLSPDDEGPAILVDWYRAAGYCNWLSRREGIPEKEWCYETDKKGNVTALKREYLSLQGYRLPTEAEWEYACRAGTLTSRCYGETEELLPWYGWYVKNSRDRTWPVGSKKPNDLGLFDMHGNVWNWCQESYQGFYRAPKEGEVIEDKEDVLQIISTNKYKYRGGSFNTRVGLVRSAVRIRDVPTIRTGNVGFRPARTITP